MTVRSLPLSTCIRGSRSLVFQAEWPKKGDSQKPVSMRVECVVSTNHETRIIVGSIRSVIDIENAVITEEYSMRIPLQFSTKW